MKYAFYANLICVLLIVSVGLLQNKNCFAIKPNKDIAIVETKQKSDEAIADIQYNYLKYTSSANAGATNHNSHLFADNVQSSSK